MYIWIIIQQNEKCHGIYFLGFDPFTMSFFPIIINNFSHEQQQ